MIRAIKTQRDVSAKPGGKLPSLTAAAGGALLSNRCCVCKCALMKTSHPSSADWGANTLRTSPLGLRSYSKRSVCLRPFCSADEGRGVLIKAVPSSPGECSPTEPIETILLVRTGGTFSRKSRIIIINWVWSSSVRLYQCCSNHSIKAIQTTTEFPL